MKFEIASKNKEIKELEKIAEKIQDIEKFAEWRENKIYEKRLSTAKSAEDIDKEITTNDLKKYNITNWRTERRSRNLGI